MTRMCLSGDASCTGIAPCVECDRAMLTVVLPQAMIGGGFNGSAEIAQGFFLAYKEAHERLLSEVGQRIAQVHTAPPEENTPNEPEQKTSKEPYEEPAVTEEELLGMGQPEDFVEDEPEPVAEPAPATFSPKAARDLARRARKLKQNRAGVQKKEEDTHGKDG